MVSVMWTMRQKEYIDSIIEENGFWKHVPEMLSRAFAEGGCVLREYIKDDRIAVNYISTADINSTLTSREYQYSGISLMMRMRTMLFTRKSRASAGLNVM